MSKFLREGATIILDRRGRTWRTQLIRVTDENLIVDVGEILPSALASLEVGTSILGRTHEQEYRISFETTILSFTEDFGHNYLSLSPPQNYERRQRRKHLRVMRRIPASLNVTLRNDILTRSLGKSFQYDCWIQATIVNISGGGLRMLPHVPKKHSVISSGVPKITCDFEGVYLDTRPLNWVRMDWSSDEPVLVFSFADLTDDEGAEIEKHNVRWLSTMRNRQT
jgi:hypothetical protein